TNNRNPLIHIPAKTRNLFKTVIPLRKMHLLVWQACFKLFSVVPECIQKIKSNIVPLHAEILWFCMEMRLKFFQKINGSRMGIIGPVWGNILQFQVMKKLFANTFKLLVTVKSDKCK